MRNFIANLDIGGALRALRAKEFSAVEMVGGIFSAIKAENLAAFVTLNEAGAMAAARDYDAGKIKGRLAGIPIAVKDNIDVAGLPSTCGSRALKSVPKSTASSVKKLLDEGAILIGKTNMDEFAMGSSSATSAFGTPLNPIDKSRVCGGSSGGSACAVAASYVLAALGSDTGGSIRQPASYCGLAGLKPSPNMIDKSGLYPLAPSFDQIGPFAKNVDDIELIFSILSGFSAKRGQNKPIIGVIANLELRWADAKTAQDAAVKRFIERGYTVKSVSVDLFKRAGEIYSACAYAQMFDSISALDLDMDLLGGTVKKRLKIGGENRAVPHIIAAAEAIKNDLSAQFDDALSVCDCIITPTAPSVAFRLDENEHSDAIICSDFYTQPPSLCSLSALSVPFYKSGKLPLGIQIIAKDESKIFDIARVLG